MVKRRAAPNPEAMMIAVRFAGGRRVDGEEEGEDGDEDGDEEVFMVFFFLFFFLLVFFLFSFLIFVLFFRIFLGEFFVVVVAFLFCDGDFLSFLFKNWGGVFVVWLVGW